MNTMNRRNILKMGGALLSLPLMNNMASAAETALKIAFILPGPRDDGGWSLAHYRGAQAVKERFGDKVEITFVENISAEADAERVIRDLAQTGHKLIFICTVGEIVYRVARTLPDVMFEQCEGAQTTNNVGAYSLRFHEGHAIEGAIAGRMSKTGKIGCITAFPIPTVNMALNAFTIMARKANPAIEVTPAWLSTFYDPAKESDAARAFIDQGADILISHMDGPAVLQIAQQRGIKAFGLGRDMSEFAPKAQLTAIIYDWGVHYVDSVQKAIDGTWKAEDVWIGMAQNAIRMAPLNSDIPSDIANEIETIRQKIIDGSFSPFDGPIQDNKGNEVVPADKRLDGHELITSAWYVAGVKP